MLGRGMSDLEESQARRFEHVVELGKPLIRDSKDELKVTESPKTICNGSRFRSLQTASTAGATWMLLSYTLKPTPLEAARDSMAALSPSDESWQLVAALLELSNRPCRTSACGRRHAEMRVSSISGDRSCPLR